MSESRCYEFVALDRQLTAKHMGELVPSTWAGGVRRDRYESWSRPRSAGSSPSEPLCGRRAVSWHIADLVLVPESPVG
jgi:hypothetical protein